MDGEGRQQLDRRQFLRNALAAAVAVGGISDFALLISKSHAELQEAKSELQAQGITPADPKALETAKKIRQENAKNPPTNQKTEQVQKGEEVEAQQIQFRQAREELLQQKKGE